ncbi:hydrogenobyrinic acid a,c-diamide synthase (glutamine-hydrolyzing) [Rhodomicrobium vannielii ATCC 17100]|uniref:cobyrinate a,c-diamide synthase n=1 Tax=Rhodomicrobium vannielii TaxID=1069 RepID=UPI00191B7D5B|nr:cobyrinate a,c-diamide synthase [Rhodomicrobium vannielii]MBJ7534245.1 hydrogenobyrinic acid a,c-diamide synthase (glutamine-hydrolyzing) [Rhodomicrobium vannielii ATCC 17100]
MARVLIAAAHKSSGKTTLSVGLAAALAARGLKVQTFKKGPDYIDPMWLSHASGRPCYNLDFNTHSTAEILSSAAARESAADIALIETNKGLHDGVDLEGKDSGAALAKLLAAPVILVIDALGMTRGIAPLVLGYQAFDRETNIAGIIINKIGTARQQDKICQALERYTDIPVLGAVPRDKGFSITERHLGLMTPSETPELRGIIARLRTAVEGGVDVNRLLAIGRAAPPLPGCFPASRSRTAGRPLRIAIARDSAFGFYYADDLEAFEREDARLCFFDTLSDNRLPDADGLFIGGGFPETQGAGLEANGELRADIARRIRAGLPTYAECGGMMYLARSIRWKGVSHEMVGVIPADAVMYDRPQGRGLVILHETREALWTPPGASPCANIPGHEFHYAALENMSSGQRFAYRVARGEGIGGGRDGIVIGNLLASFSHLRSSPSNPWVKRFVAFARSRLDAAVRSEPDYARETMPIHP